ncbi:MAG: DUF86 domain-containing protein [Nanoarchaeota archaeon]|nr:DUF86 domain-containing protein [Nanoarchaeota archaeon]
MKAEIEVKLRELKKYAQLLNGYKKESISSLEKNPTLRGAVERYLQLSIEIVIEIGEMIIANRGFRKPETYREVIELLGEEDVIQKAFAKKLAPAAGFRNILIHRYGEVKIEELYRHLQNDIKDFDTFAKQISSYLKG